MQCAPRLEKYRWRDTETRLNSLPQFRTAISVPSSDAPLRLHFLHVRSPHPSAVPLLLIPPFPFSNLSFGHLLKPLTEPDDAAASQPFHLVIPALPGLGFSDPLPNNTPAISATADMLNTLMGRLSYPHYLATNTGPATSSPAEIDWRLIDYLAMHYPASCLGAHLLSPPLVSPTIHQDPWEWTKWSVASFMQAGILGYSDDDFVALDRASSNASPAPTGSTSAARKLPEPRQHGLNQLELREPNTIAYALCDSPTGLLVFVLKSLRLIGPLMNFSPEQLITFAELAWLPGPENALRFWSYCATHNEAAKTAAKPNVAITVFIGGKSGVASGALGASVTAEFPQVMMPAESGAGYACPAWGNSRYSVLFAQRLPGQPGLLAWERPAAIAAGVRGLAREVLKRDGRLRPAPEPATAPLEQVVVVPVPGPSSPPQPDVPQKPEPQPLQGHHDGQHGESSETRVATSPQTPDASPAEDSKALGKAPEDSKALGKAPEDSKALGKAPEDSKALGKAKDLEAAPAVPQEPGAIDTPAAATSPPPPGPAP